MASSTPLLCSSRSAPLDHQQHVSEKAAQGWKKLQVRVKRSIHMRQFLFEMDDCTNKTQKMKQMKKHEKRMYIAKAMTLIVFLGTATAMSKSAIFHIKAVGLWDHGIAYKFSHALSLTFAIFLLKVLVACMEACVKKGEHDDGQRSKSPATDANDDEAAEVSLKDKIMPWVLLIVMTFFEMLSGTLASTALLYGTPTTLFVVFKSSKVVFLAIISVIILRKTLNGAQWMGLLVISGAILLATVAEGKDMKKGGGFSLVGPLLLTLSEVCHAFFLVLQEISVKSYWPRPLQLLGISAMFGALMTAGAMWMASTVMVALPDGGHRPGSDWSDAIYMCLSNPVLGFVMVFHLSVHVSSDVMHIFMLQHISALARTLCDAVKLIFMWCLGKLFWLLGVLPFLAEAWHPGLVGSWLMLPATCAIVYGLFMFKKKVYLPIAIEDRESGPSSRSGPLQRLLFEDFFNESRECVAVV